MSDGHDNAGSDDTKVNGYEDGLSNGGRSGSAVDLGSEDEALNFESPEEEAAHYRREYSWIRDALQHAKAELDEFQNSSKDLEEALEKELAATEERQAELLEKIKKLEVEKDDWKAKHVSLQKNHSSTVTNMQREMDNLRSERDKTLVALRDLEMGNDELERNERVAVSSLLDLESKYNRAIEEKTLLEQEVIQRQELEEESQRLRDELRDANTEIGILRDQMSRGIPTPPSSVSGPISPAREPSRELVADESRLAISERDITSQRVTPEPLASRTGSPLPRSGTTSSIPTLSPSVKRLSKHLMDVPDTASRMGRSSTMRQLSTTSALPASPSLRRVKGSVSTQSPSKISAQKNAAALSNGRTIMNGLHALQARLKATNDGLGSKVSGRNTSNPMPFGTSKRAVSSTSTITAPTPVKATHSRVAALQRPDGTPAPSHDGDKTGATFVSPNGWVLVSDNDNSHSSDDTPTNYKSRSLDPTSPLISNFRSASAASSSSSHSRHLPSRPSIPSPLNASLSKSTSSNSHRPPSQSSNLALSSRASSRQGGSMSQSGSSRVSALAASSRTSDLGSSSRSSRQHSDDSRPLSPTMIPQPRSYIRSPTPHFDIVPLSASTSASSRPSSRAGNRSIGKGLPPGQPTPSLSSSVRSIIPSSALRKSGRRSSLGVAEQFLPPTGIPEPRSPSARPISVPVFGANTPPPPVPRVPSAHVRESARRQGILGSSKGKG